MAIMGLPPRCQTELQKVCAEGVSKAQLYEWLAGRPDYTRVCTCAAQVIIHRRHASELERGGFPILYDDTTSSPGSSSVSSAAASADSSADSSAADSSAVSPTASAAAAASCTST